MNIDQQNKNFLIQRLEAMNEHFDKMIAILEKSKVAMDKTDEARKELADSIKKIVTPN